MDGNAKASQVTIDFTSPPSAEQREVVERSIEALRRRVDHLNSVRRAADEALAVLGPAPDRERIEIAEDDPAAIAAAEAVAREQREIVAAMTFDAPFAAPAEPPPFDRSSAAGGAADEVFPIPYHYDWRWHDGRMVYRLLPDRPNGQITVEVVGKRRGDAHAGFGVVLRTDRDHHVTARSVRRSWEKYRVWSGVTGAVALAEGGTEMTVFEGDRMLDISQDKRFRMRLNPGFWGSGEHAEHDSGGFGAAGPLEVSWFMRRGFTYTLNVGAWVLAEWTDGPHASGPVAGASGSIVAKVLAITLFHH